MGVRIDATRRIRLNDPGAAATRPHIKLPGPHVFLTKPNSLANSYLDLVTNYKR